jgi:hypothetical protein
MRAGCAWVKLVRLGLLGFNAKGFAGPCTKRADRGCQCGRAWAFCSLGKAPHVRRIGSSWLSRYAHKVISSFASALVWIVLKSEPSLAKRTEMMSRLPLISGTKSSAGSMLTRANW